MELPSSIVGLVMASAWEEEEGPSNVFIRTREGEEYLVEGFLAEEMLGHLRSRVRVTGKTWRTDFEHHIEVTTYIVLDE